MKAIAIVSDTHCGSTVALCPNRPIELDDNQFYRPSEAQVWLWDKWLEAWQWVESRLNYHNVDGLMIAINGDVFDGDHHDTHQIISRSSYVQTQIAHEVFDVAWGLEPDRVVVVRGTESHVGKGGSSEESFARGLAEKGLPVVGQGGEVMSHYQYQVEVEGALLDFTHHGRTGHRPWTRHNATLLLAAQITMERIKEGSPLPKLAVRSHFHRISDSYDAHPVRVLQTPAWQLRTSYVVKKHVEGLADVGICIAFVDDGEVVKIEKKEYIPAASRGKVDVWR